MGRAVQSAAVVISCEHASPAVPAGLRGLGVTPALLHSHVGFDVGALPVARQLAAAFGQKLRAGRWSRLVADLNRSAAHPLVIARQAHGHPIPGNRDLTAAERLARLSRYWQGYRRDLEAAVRDLAARRCCVHFSVHSFVERLNGVERRNDIGLLFDHRRPNERRLVERLKAGLLAQGFRVRLNFPYFGHTDGMTSHLRGCLPRSRYLGIEIELNQRLVRIAAGQRRVGVALVEAARDALTA